MFRLPHTIDIQPTNIMAIEIIIDGTTKTVTKRELFDLAARGVITPDTPINVNGKLATAGKAKGIVFGSETNERFASHFAGQEVAAG